MLFTAWFITLYESHHIEIYALNGISHGIEIHIRLARGGLSDSKNKQYSANLQNSISLLSHNQYYNTKLSPHF